MNKTRIVTRLMPCVRVQPVGDLGLRVFIPGICWVSRDPRMTGKYYPALINRVSRTRAVGLGQRHRFCGTNNNHDDGRSRSVAGWRA